MLEKIREAALAYHLTRKWSKRKILTEYLNSIYFGNGAYGIESAARTYFGSTTEHFGCGKPENRCASELLPHEAALLAGMVASPSAYDPVVNREAATRRRNLVLGKMLEQGYITRTEYEGSIRAQVPTTRRRSAPRRRRRRASRRRTSRRWVRQQVVDRFGPREALLGGLRVQTTLDLGMQRRAEDAITRWLGNPPSGPQAALVAINNTTGEVRAMVGGSDYNKAPFNLATQGQRQPGSAFKPFVLATALRQGISPGSTWVSKKQVIQVPNSIEKFTVNNYDERVLRREHAGARDDVLRQRRLRPGRHQGRDEAHRPHRRADGHPHAGLQQLRDHARRPAARRDPAGHGARLPDVRDRRPARDRQPRRGQARPGRHPQGHAARQSQAGPAAQPPRSARG